jgi:hypothetical protein
MPLFYNEQDYNDYHYGSPMDGLTPMQALYEEGKAAERLVEDDRFIIRWMQQLGFWVVVCHRQKYCRYTDAIIPGSHQHLHASSDDPYELKQMIKDIYSGDYVDDDVTYELLAPAGHRETCPLLTHIQLYDHLVNSLIPDEEDIPF